MRYSIPPFTEFYKKKFKGKILFLPEGLIKLALEGKEIKFPTVLGIKGDMSALKDMPRHFSLKVGKGPACLLVILPEGYAFNMRTSYKGKDRILLLCRVDRGGVVTDSLGKVIQAIREIKSIGTFLILNMIGGNMAKEEKKQAEETQVKEETKKQSKEKVESSKDRMDRILSFLEGRGNLRNYSSILEEFKNSCETGETFNRCTEYIYSDIKNVGRSASATALASTFLVEDAARLVGDAALTPAFLLYSLFNSSDEDEE